MSPSSHSCQPVRRALLSVSDKTGLVDLARALQTLGVELISTGGSARILAESDIKVTEVANITGFPEIMDGRVKTLHPLIHGGLLGRRGTDDEVMATHGIPPIDLLVVNLYPFEATVAQADATLESCIENIDIGGPAMLRAAAKNHAHVAVTTDPNDYAGLVEMLSQQGGTTLAWRRQQAARAYAHTARYDGLIADWLGNQIDSTSPLLGPWLHLAMERQQELRYGENPHQSAALYRDKHVPAGCVTSAELLAGKPLSYNNIADADAALECVKAFDAAPACVIVKHANPCGAALGDSTVDAYLRALACDPTSAFGGIIAVNHSMDEATARTILDKQFAEVIVAPAFDDEALACFEAKPNIRLLATGAWPAHPPHSRQVKQVTGGLLVQETDRDTLVVADLKIVTQHAPDDDEMRDLLFAWHIAMSVKSNAIVYAADGRTIGIGAGQMSRVDSARIAARKAADANLDLAGSVMASDAFFPFRDGIDTAAKAGIKAVIQPGGSRRDQEVIDAANEHGIAMLFTGIRHFRH